MSTEIRAKRRAEILSAAAQEFSERGFERAKIEEIARRAGIGKSTVYEYFPSKDELLTAVLSEEFRCMNHDFEAFLEQPTAFREKLTAMLGRTGQLLLGTLSTLMQTPGSEPTVRFMRNNGEKERDFVLSLLEKSVRKAIDAGEIRADIDPKFAATLFFVLLMTTANQILFANVEETMLEKTVDYLFEGLSPHGITG